MEAIVHVHNVSKSYDGLIVLDNISFEVRTGEVFGILGPNGAGKTTILETLETLRLVESGELTIAGVSVTEQPDKIRQIIGVQLQATGFFDNLNLVDLLGMFASFYGEKVDPYSLLREVQLEDKAKSQVKKLSGGQKQRFSIAAALVNSPKVLFLDEPTTGLDPQARRNLWELIQSIKEKGVTIIMTTHYLEEAEMLCDRVAIMDDGKIIALDTPAKLVAGLIGRGFKKQRKAALATLEDVFIDLTGKALRD